MTIWAYILRMPTLEYSFVPTISAVAVPVSDSTANSAASVTDNDTPGSRATMVPSSPIATRLRRNESPAKSAARTPSPNSVVLTSSFSSNFDRLK
eukprot:CAMPEP_0182585112 /NCGR_PEP_ID=MMETSP1324-20130603/59488_1 /TAXON_ID=236786 /ORGANISM="Florenciella sp., Strain RCC1587" /LENGTH=94 /DNA_ID=CAMNT_0024801885 /DNA_START=249 /DNA_END=533 /DNA_ORIENTATION=+